MDTFIKIFVIFFSFSFCFLSCNSKKVAFGAEEIYLLQEEERPEPVNRRILKVYQDYNKYSDIQIPLNKYVKHLRYELFIGIILNKKFNQSWLEIKNKKAYAVLENENLCKIFYKENDMFLIKALINNQNSHSTYLFNYISPDSSTLRTIFNENLLENKIILHN